jgi:hypothetical protein
VVESFSLRDLNNDGVPELIIAQRNEKSMDAVLTVYTYDGNVYKIGDYSNPKKSFISWFYFSKNPMFPGLFEYWWDEDAYHYGYLSVKEGKLVYEYLYYIDVAKMEMPQRKWISNDEQLINESIDVHPEYEYTDNLLNSYHITEENITDGIGGYGINEPQYLSNSAIECDNVLMEKAWQKAYTAFLRDFSVADNTIATFSLRDLDNNGIPELIIEQHNAGGALDAVLTVYAYDENVYKVGDYSNPKGSFVGWFRFSNNPTFRGLFEEWYGGNVYHYGYLSVKEGELIYEYLYYIDTNKTEMPQQDEISDDKQLINESINVHLLREYDDLLKQNIINEENINDVIVRYGN